MELSTEETPSVTRSQVSAPTDDTIIKPRTKAIIALACSGAISVLSLLIAWQSLRVSRISHQLTVDSSISDKRSRIHAQISEAQHLNYEISSTMYRAMVYAAGGDKSDVTLSRAWQIITDAQALRAQLYEVETAIPNIESLRDLDTLSHRLSEVITVTRGLAPYADELVQRHGRGDSRDEELLGQTSSYVHHARGVLIGKNCVNPPLWPKADRRAIVPESSAPLLHPITVPSHVSTIKFHAGNTNAPLNGTPYEDPLGTYNVPVITPNVLMFNPKNDPHRTKPLNIEFPPGVMYEANCFELLLDKPTSASGMVVTSNVSINVETAPQM